MLQHIRLVKNDSRYWVVFLITGTILILAGVYGTFYPFSTHTGLARFTGVAALHIGMVKLAFAFSNKKIHGRKWQIVIASMDLTAGLLLLFYTGSGLFILPFLLSFWILAGLATLLETISGIKLSTYSETEKLAGALMMSLVCGAVVTYIPLVGVFVTIFFTVVILIITGAFYLFLSLRLWMMQRKLPIQFNK